MNALKRYQITRRSERIWEQQQPSKRTSFWPDDFMHADNTSFVQRLSNLEGLASHFEFLEAQDFRTSLFISRARRAFLPIYRGTFLFRTGSGQGKQLENIGDVAVLKSVPPAKPLS
jgi:hypothetical protein